MIPVLFFIGGVVLAWLAILTIHYGARFQTSMHSVGVLGTAVFVLAPIVAAMFIIGSFFCFAAMYNGALLQ